MEIESCRAVVPLGLDHTTRGHVGVTRHSTPVVIPSGTTTDVESREIEAFMGVHDACVDGLP